jgi:phosphatidylinositol alpha 1,6-mannosyltransferase
MLARTLDRAHTLTLLCAPFAEHIYIPSFSLAEDLAAKGIDAHRFRLWPRGIDVARFSPSHRSKAMRLSWNVTDDRTIVLLIVTRIVWEKNIQVLY